MSVAASFVGGQVLLAARAPARAEYAGIVRFLDIQVRKLDVDVRVGVEATASLVLTEGPDSVIVATGAHAYVPPVPGADGKHVVTDRDVLLDVTTAGENVVVVDDVHTQQGLSTAELLLDDGKRVEVISRLFYAGQDAGITSIAPLYARLFAGVDTVVLSMGSRSTDGLYRELKGRVAELYAVGDCVAPRGVHQAILDATRAARQL